MTIRALFAAVAAALLAGCGGEPAPTEETPPSPILYQIASSDGEVEGWLFGTIHALPDDTEWRTAAFDQVASDADLLVVEVADLGDQAAGAAHFNRLALTPGQPDILTRVPPDARPKLAALMDRSGFDSGDFSAIETWAAALMLAQGVQYGEPANGVDRALLREFAGRRIEELEGVEYQFRLFDGLAETDQRDLLLAMLDDMDRAEADPARLTRIWLSGDVAALLAESDRGLLADPELRETLLTRRNHAWSERIAALIADEPRPLVAVGTAHLVGDDGVAAKLRALGLVVTRIQ